jgi:predicted dehydrogenase
VLARNGQPGANDRIVYGHIGVGGMGSSHIVPDACAAICDVDANHLARAAKRVTAARRCSPTTTGACWTAKTLTP